MHAVVQVTLPINKLVNERCWLSVRSCTSRDTLQCCLHAQERMCWVPFPNLCTRVWTLPTTSLQVSYNRGRLLSTFLCKSSERLTLGTGRSPGNPLKLSAAPPPCLSWFLPLILSYYSRTVLSMLFSDTVWSESGIREAGG